MDNDKFLIVLIAEYKENIEQVLCDCEHVYRSTIDYELLELKINELIISAKSNGLDEKLIQNLVHTIIPSYINYLNHKRSGKKAA
jgi:hypothetical protein